MLVVAMESRVLVLAVVEEALPQALAQVQAQVQVEAQAPEEEEAAEWAGASVAAVVRGWAQE